LPPAVGADLLGRLVWRHERRSDTVDKRSV
jgi:hypothetical protein